MTYAQLCDKIEKLDRRTTILKEDYEVVDVLKAYLKCGTIQTITGLNVCEHSWITVHTKNKKKEQVKSRTIINIKCTEGVFVVDLLSPNEVTLQSNYHKNLEKLNLGITLYYSKGYPKNTPAPTIEVTHSRNYLEDAHKYLDTLPTSSCKSLKEIFELALVELLNQPYS